MASPQYSLARRSDVTHTGDMTWYDVGVGSCGNISSFSEHIVALSPAHMGSVPNPNLNPICGSTITIEQSVLQGFGVVLLETYADTPVSRPTGPSCGPNAIDCSSSLFKAVAPNGDGRVVVDWRFNDSGNDSSAPVGDLQPTPVVPNGALLQPPSPTIAGPNAGFTSPPCTTSISSVPDKAVDEEHTSIVATIIAPAVSIEELTIVPSPTIFAMADLPSWETHEATIATIVPAISTIAVASTVTQMATPQTVTDAQTTATAAPAVVVVVDSIETINKTQRSTIELTQSPTTAEAVSEVQAPSTSSQIATISTSRVPMWPIMNGTTLIMTTFIKTTPMPTRKPSPTPYTGKARAPGIAKAMLGLLLALPNVAAVML
ncbi:hypothetical protein LTR78_009722 [Recurvomyces mirabilis]|uniref:Uncharacterized protein n=1 Tax=Recurvomyces mirabilis TaxID=574656 RepID=A0AAE0TP07_9PEZI|nr:hypothetical protein LTR78_009722 [Recurvomyces mirabilis]KAK5156345.1 hypothetical protein LTS14_005233 [Recurvomyces mirabilis]